MQRSIFLIVIYCHIVVVPVKLLILGGALIESADFEYANMFSDDDGIKTYYNLYNMQNIF